MGNTVNSIPDDPNFNAKEWVESTIKSGPVVMISKSYCPFCKKAYRALSAYTKNINKIEIDLEYGDYDQMKIQNYCKRITGSSTVPKVFIGGEYIGGGDDTDKLHKLGKLGPLIQKAIAAQQQDNE